MFRVPFERFAARFVAGCVATFVACATQAFAAQALAEPVFSGIQPLATALPPGASATTASFANTNSTPLPDQANVTSTLQVAGAGTFLWDVDLTTSISHTWCGDLEIELFAPSGKRVTITNDNAEGYAYVFSDTLWDDSAPTPAYIYPYANFVNATPINSEGKFARLAGDDPNGTWTLRINDDAALDSGTLHAWRLDLTTLGAPPIAPNAMLTFVSTPSLPLVDFTAVSDAIPVAGLAPNLAEAGVRIDIRHTYNADLVIELGAPTGQTIRFASYIGGDLDDIFAGTDVLDDTSDLADPLLDAPIALFAYVDGVAAPAVNPEGTLASLRGIDPNGTWTLRVEDTAGLDTGTFASWELSLATYAPPPTSYCTAGTTTNGCAPSISASANPSVTFAHACDLTIAGVEGAKSAILFYGLAPSASVWAPSSTSFLCVKSPTQRTATQSSGGTPNACDGVLGLDWNAFQGAHPGALGAPWVIGEKAFVQAWFRDPPAPRTTNLSDALELTYQP